MRKRLGFFGAGTAAPIVPFQLIELFVHCKNVDGASDHIYGDLLSQQRAALPRSELDLIEPAIHVAARVIYGHHFEVWHWPVAGRPEYSASANGTDAPPFRHTNAKSSPAPARPFAYMSRPCRRELPVVVESAQKSLHLCRKELQHKWPSGGGLVGV
jgi:hypothetical protein